MSGTSRMPLAGVVVITLFYTPRPPAARARLVAGTARRHSSAPMHATTPTSFPRVDAMLDTFATALGRDFAAYRNHVQRVLSYFVALAPGPIPETVIVAAAFHDLGIWTDD